MKRKRELEEKVRREKRREGKYREKTKKEEKEFVKEILTYLEEGDDPKEFMMNNIIEVLGYKRRGKEKKKYKI